MNITTDTTKPINSDLAALLAEAAEHHITTNRRASVTLKLTVTKEKKSGERQVRAKLSAVLPEGEDDSRTVKRPEEVLLSVEDEHPGQMRIEP